jgi:minor extracellular serine protease Vpr
MWPELLQAAVAGIVGLLLEADSSWTPTQVMAILAQTAIHDNYTGVITANGNNTWGFGKVNAYGAIKEALNFTGIHHQENAALNCIVYPNPGNGEYSIGLTAEKNETMQVNVLDLSGRQIQVQTWEVHAGSNTMQLNLAELPAVFIL